MCVCVYTYMCVCVCKYTYMIQFSSILKYGIVVDVDWDRDGATAAYAPPIARRVRLPVGYNSRLTPWAV